MLGGKTGVIQDGSQIDGTDSNFVAGDSDGDSSGVSVLNFVGNSFGCPGKWTILYFLEAST